MAIDRNKWIIWEIITLLFYIFIGLIIHALFLLVYFITFPFWKKVSWKKYETTAHQ